MNGIEMEMDRQAGISIAAGTYVRTLQCSGDDRKRRVNDDPRVLSLNPNSFVPISWHFDNYFQFLSIAAIHLSTKPLLI